jgi:perilipin-2
MSAETNGKSNGTVAKPDTSLLPHLESWERMMKLPVVEAAWNQSQEVYDKMRGELSDQK